MARKIFQGMALIVQLIIFSSCSRGDARSNEEPLACGVAPSSQIVSCPTSAQFEAGLMLGDVILEVDRKPVRTAQDFDAIVKEKRSYLLRVQRSDPSGVNTFAVVALNLKN